MPAGRRGPSAPDPQGLGQDLELEGRAFAVDVAVDLGVSLPLGRDPDLAGLAVDAHLVLVEEGAGHDRRRSRPSRS